MHWLKDGRVVKGEIVVQQDLEGGRRGGLATGQRVFAAGRAVGLSGAWLLVEGGSPCRLASACCGPGSVKAHCLRRAHLTSQREPGAQRTLLPHFGKKGT